MPKERLRLWLQRLGRAASFARRSNARVKSTPPLLERPPSELIGKAQLCACVWCESTKLHANSFP
jgi:hypothetical protein